MTFVENRNLCALSDGEARIYRTVVQIQMPKPKPLAINVFHILLVRAKSRKTGIDSRLDVYILWLQNYFHKYL